MSLGVAGASGVAGYAHFIEHRSNLEEEKLREQHHAPQYHVPSLPRVYNREALHSYWDGRPVSTTKRLISVCSELGPRFLVYAWDFHVVPSSVENDDQLQHVHAAKLRHALMRLGPAFVKAGQQLSIGPDLVPPAVLKELQRLRDSVQPIPDSVALQLLQEELQCENLSDVFDDLHLVASASLGQVYKADLVESGETVAWREI
jgi:predicted unusual protein kinase regulating ubiquinone biosynthesis (AarF/ABC1/UbiB family)